MGLEVCATLGMLNPEQAKQLKEAGLTAYNHNLDTSPEYYPKVSYSVRLQWSLELTTSYSTKRQPHHPIRR